MKKKLKHVRSLLDCIRLSFQIIVSGRKDAISVYEKLCNLICSMHSIQNGDPENSFHNKHVVQHVNSPVLCINIYLRGFQSPGMCQSSWSLSWKPQNLKPHMYWSVIYQHDVWNNCWLEHSRYRLLCWLFLSITHMEYSDSLPVKWSRPTSAASFHGRGEKIRCLSLVLSFTRKL